MAQDIIPKVSVVMSVHNGEHFLKMAVDSILNQSFSEFEFIIINDGSTDKTDSILKSYDDSRIRIFKQENKGLVASLNRGIHEAKGTYIARHDADDASKPDRLHKQLQFLLKNPHVIALGSSMDVMNDQNQVLHSHHVLIDDPELRQELLIRSPFAHGSVVFHRESAIKAGLYNQEFWPAEDYDLWLKLSKYGNLANIDEPLYIYREHKSGISFINQAKQTEKSKSVGELAWQQRNRLISKRRINLNKYKGLEDGHARIQRILKNISAVNKIALKQKQKAFVLKNSSLIWLTPVTYKKLAGNIKRKIRK